MYANVSLWKAKSTEGLDTLLGKAEAELLPKLQSQPGFRDLQVVRADGDTLILIHTWESKDQSNSGLRRLTPWLLANTATKLSLISRHGGDVVISGSAE
ncbi:MAG TPA: hypothetical protein VFI42_12345 [Thermomicrobiaceae bacterium]|nr:hypothetical protein [Thermomicrobiaceae bacterium]